MSGAEQVPTRLTDLNPSPNTQHPALPSWCERRRGGSAILLVAPHGGRRPAIDASAPPPNLRVNDVYTPELTRLLAGRLDAGVIINHGMDRNQLDLNRTSQVRRQAPWFLQLLTQEIGAIVARHGRAEVLFIHGWNTGQPKCDIGIGAIETADGLHVPAEAALTVGEPYLAERITPLRAACVEAGVVASLGERYPASHRNNLLQVFTPRGQQLDDPHARQLATWAAGGSVQAVQLELGIPLRWPGVWRDRLTAAIVASFHPATRGVPSAPVAPRPTAPRAAAASLQFYDAAADIGIFAGAGRVGPRSTGGRLLFFLGGQRIALFTGDDVHGGHVEPLRLEPSGTTLRLRFAGPTLQLDDAAVYLDLEAALAASRLVDATVDLDFQPASATADGPQFGRVRGRLAVGERRADIDAGGFANAAALRASGSGQQTMIAADFGAAGALLSRHTSDGARAAIWQRTDAAAQSLAGGRIAVTPDGDTYTPRLIELHHDGSAPLRAWPQSRMGILRPAANGAYMRVTFGVARCAWGAHDGWGLYEHAVPLSRPE